MTPPAEPTPTAIPDDRADRVERVVAETVARRQAGELIAGAQVIADHPDLLPDLGESLRRAAHVRRAFLAARRGGVAAGVVLAVLSDDELDAPIADDATVPTATAVPQIPGYEILSALPRGGQAAVYLARQLSTGRRVAVKVLTDGRFAALRARLRFDREVDVLVALDHPHLVSVVDAGETVDGAPFLVMPYVDGWSLDAFLAAPAILGGLGGADAAAVLSLFERLTRAVHAAHAAGVIHRDLKPSNIRVDRNGEPRVLDFGLARLLDPDDGPAEGTASGPASTVTRERFIGTPAWTSPEQAAGSAADADARADVYALGVMLYRAVAGRSPYPEEVPPHRLLRHILGTVPAEPSGSPTARAGVDRRTDAVVLKCLAKDRDDRYPSAAALADDIALCRTGGRPLALVDYAPVRSPRRSLSVPTAWAAAAATVAVAAAVWDGTVLGLLGPARPLSLPPAPPTATSRSPARSGRPTVRYAHALPGLLLTRIDPASFTARTDAGKPAVVRVDHPFWIGQTEVTRQQFATLMGSTDRDWLPSEAQLPVASVTRAQAVEFCRLLGSLDGHRYRLPTAAEWELAARSGANGVDGNDRFGAAAAAADVCWFSGNSGGRPHVVRGKPASTAGLWDMNGNVAEWCDDPGPGSPATAVCGGSYERPAEQCTNGSRLAVPPDLQAPGIGFRVAMTADDDPPGK